MNLHKVPDCAALIERRLRPSSVRGIKEIGTQILKGGNSLGQRPSLADTGAGGVNLTVEQRRALQRGESTYKELCFSCHGADGKGAPMQGRRGGPTLAPPLAGSPRVHGHRDYVIKVLLHGLTGDIEGKTYGDARSWCRWDRTPTSGSPTSPATCATRSATARAFVTPAQVAVVRKESKRRAAVDVRGAAADDPDAADQRGGVEAHREPQSGRRGERDRGTPGARWDPGAPQAPGSGSRSSCRSRRACPNW